MRRVPPRSQVARRVSGAAIARKVAVASGVSGPSKASFDLEAGGAAGRTENDGPAGVSQIVSGVSATAGSAGTPGFSGVSGPSGTAETSGFSGSAAGAAPAVPAGIKPGDFFTLLMTDFQGEYQVYIAAAGECLVMVRFALSLLAAPFAATIALVSAKVVPAAWLTSWEHLPGYLFGLLAAFGVLAILPYLRMIEASITHVRTARAMNNFRLLYARELRGEFAARGWSPNLPVDPSYPDSFAPLSWPGINAIVLATLEAGYITVGMVGLARVRPAPLLIVFGTATIAMLLFSVYYIRTNVSRRRKEPANPLGFPRVET